MWGLGFGVLSMQLTALSAVQATVPRADHPQAAVAPARLDEVRAAIRPQHGVSIAVQAVAKIEKYRKKHAKEEGDVRFELAPLKKIDMGVPGNWKKLLQSEDPVAQVLQDLWLPVRDLLPQTVAGLQAKLRAIGLLQTKDYPYSLIYVFEEDGDPSFHRGYPCRPLKRDEAKHLPADFLALYKVHNGWTDLHGCMGLLPSEDWFDLNDIYDGEYAEEIPGVRLRDFFVISDSAGAGYFGFDMSKNPPTGGRRAGRGRARLHARPRWMDCL